MLKIFLSIKTKKLQTNHTQKKRKNTMKHYYAKCASALKKAAKTYKY